MPALSPRGVSLDVSDELATTKRQCRHLLRRLFRTVSCFGWNIAVMDDGCMRDGGSMLNIVACDFPADLYQNIYMAYK